MTEERRITPAMAAQARAELERALKSDGGVSEFELFGNKMALQKRPDGGITVGVAGQPAVSELIPGADRRPSGYPDSLPFIPGESALLTQTGDGNVTVVWMAPANGERVFVSLIEQSLSDGFTVVAEGEVPVIPARQKTLRKDDVEREIIISGNIVSLIVSLL